MTAAVALEGREEVCVSVCVFLVTFHKELVTSYLNTPSGYILNCLVFGERTFCWRRCTQSGANFSQLVDVASAAQRCEKLDVCCLTLLSYLKNAQMIRTKT